MVKAIFGKSALGKSALAGIMCLLGSTASVGETLTSGAVAPSLKIDGFTAINTYFVNQQRRENGRGGPQPHIGVDASNLFFTIAGASASGLEYMYRVTIESIPKSSNIIDQNYVQLKSRWGTFQFGDTVGPEDTMIYDAGRIIGGTGGFDGGYSNVYNMSAGVIRGNDNIGDTGNATKIVYYSPEISGFQLGVAYTPNTAHRGDDKLNNYGSSSERLPGNRGLWDYARVQPADLRSFAVGLTYKKEIGPWSMTLSGAGITAKSYIYNNNMSTGAVTGGRVALQNTKAYQLGAIFGYGDIRFGGGFLDNGNSHLPRNRNFTFNNTAATNMNLGSMGTGNAGRAWNLGAGYTMGAYRFAGSYQRTTRNTGDLMKAQSDFWSFTTDVTPVNGLTVYAEADYIRSRTNSEAVAREDRFLAGSSNPQNRAVGNNSGLLGIVGTKVAF